MAADGENGKKGMAAIFWHPLTPCPVSMRRQHELIVFHVGLWKNEWRFRMSATLKIFFVEFGGFAPRPDPATERSMSWNDVGCLVPQKGRQQVGA
jgi:hypothetical protein